MPITMPAITMPRIAILDVGYPAGGRFAVAACVETTGWQEAQAARSCCVTTDAPQDYQPGAFYLRELPALLAVLNTLKEPQPQLLVVDGYVWLDAQGRMGLGAHLHQATGLPVVGVAKRAFDGSSHAVAVYRGTSGQPLFVTSAGVEAQTAAQAVQDMHGPHRIPTLLALADRMSRTGSATHLPP